MNVRYENRLTQGYQLPDDFLGVAVDFRRRTHEQPHDAFDSPQDEMARIIAERKARVPHIGKGVVTLALAGTQEWGVSRPVGCFHAYVMGEERWWQTTRKVFLDGLWLDPSYMDAGLSLELAEAGLEVFKSDRVIANGGDVLPVLLSGALDSKNNEARWPVPARIPETVEEARLAINAILAPEVVPPVLSAPQLAAAQI